MASIEEVTTELQRHFQSDGFEVKVDKSAPDGGCLCCVVNSAMSQDKLLQEQAI